MRRSARLARTPVVAVTGRTVPGSLRAMFDGFLEKPVDMEDLCAALLRVTRRTA